MNVTCVLHIHTTQITTRIAANATQPSDNCLYGNVSHTLDGHVSDLEVDVRAPRSWSRHQQKVSSVTNDGRSVSQLTDSGCGMSDPSSYGSALILAGFPLGRELIDDDHGRGNAPLGDVVSVPNSIQGVGCTGSGQTVAGSCSPGALTRQSQLRR